MVYAGTPSKGCEACRRRKIRCDERPEGCLNCVKSKKPCPGYRDLTQLTRRKRSKRGIETTGVGPETAIREYTLVKRSASSSKPSECGRINYPGILRTPSNSNSEEYEGGSEDCLVRQNDQALVSPGWTYSFRPTTDDVAETFFFSHYIADEYTGMTLPDPLLNAIRAVGIAGVATQSGCRDLESKATKQYSIAVSQVNQALQSPRHVKKDSTLLSVLILGTYEITAGRVERSVDDWVTHVNGAAALLKIRGVEQLETLRGLRLFLQVATKLVSRCLRLGIDLPDHVHELTAAATKYVNASHPAYTCYLASMQIATFRANVLQGLVTDPRVIIARAMELDQYLTTIQDGAGSEWDYQTVLTDLYPEVVFGGVYHIHATYLGAQLLNNVRAYRISLCEIVRDCMPEPSPLDEALYQQYIGRYAALTDTMVELQRRALGCVAQHMGLIGKDGKIMNPAAIPQKPKHPWPSFQNKAYNLSSHASMEDEHGLPMLKQDGCYGILWPLFNAGIMKVTTKEVRRWIINVIRILWKSHGIQQAMSLANELESFEKHRDDPDVWKTDKPCYRNTWRPLKTH